jgi:hypothetical protein
VRCRRSRVEAVHRQPAAPAPGQTTSGSINYEVVGEGITAADAPVEVAPGAEYQLTQTSQRHRVNRRVVAKYGEDTIITDEAVSRYNFAGCQQVADEDEQLREDPHRRRCAVGDRVERDLHRRAGSKWDGSGTAPKILLDILKAKAAMTRPEPGVLREHPARG